MVLHTCIVSYNRRALTQRTLESYLETISVSYSLVIVDNGSNAETVAWLRECGQQVLFLGENKFPGYACNRGFELADANVDYLHRSDNDTLFLPGWCERACEALHSGFGQVGLIAAGDEKWADWETWPVGGNSLIRRELWDKGLRYSERSWLDGGVLEDHQLTLDVWKMGYGRKFVQGIEYLQHDDEAYKREIMKYKGLM